MWYDGLRRTVRESKQLPVVQKRTGTLTAYHNHVRVCIMAMDDGMIFIKF
jgi:hypothetical protein